MMSTLLKPLTRDQLAKFLPDQEAIRRFEQLYQVAGTDTPTEIIILFQLVEAAQLAAENAVAAANSALSSIETMMSQLEALLASRLPDPVVIPDDIQPSPPVLGTIAAQNANAVEITGGTAELASATIDALTTAGGAVFQTTNAALTDGAGAAAGTLLNAPAAGNPTKWIGIDDDGTTRYIPAW